MGKIFHLNSGGVKMSEKHKTFSCEINGIEFTWRPVTRAEWKGINEMCDCCPLDKEEKLVGLCLLSGDSDELSECAGIISTLSDCIMNTSGFVDVENLDIACSVDGEVAH